MRGGETAETIGRPKVLFIAHKVKDRAEVGRIWRKEGEKEGEEGEVALVADVVRLVW